MSVSKPSSRSAGPKKDGNFRYATRLLALEKGKRFNLSKETNALKACECLLKSDGWRGSKHVQSAKFPLKKPSNKCCPAKDGKNKIASSNNREKVVIVSKHSSSVSVVKSCSLRKSVSVKKVSYSTSVVLSSDEDTDSEEDSDNEEKNDYLKKKRTILKRTTSKVKSSFCEPKKSEAKSAKKARAIKLLCEKLSSNKTKNVGPNRELRPRFPYTMLQEWPTARAHRMASLNALAKVHVVYENEGRTVGENLNDADETDLIDFLNENSDDETQIKHESKQRVVMNVKKNEKAKNVDCDKGRNEKKNKNSVVEVKIPKRRKKRKAPEVEIIDTRVCKRMASLNAQAILAASYLQEPKPKRISKKIEKCESSSDTDEKEIIVESKCDVEIIGEKDNTLSKSNESNSTCDKYKTEIRNSPKNPTDKNIESLTVTSVSSPETEYRASWTVESEAVAESCQEEVTPLNIKASTSTTKVGLTKYTEVTKVHINTREDMEIKEERKSERKVERIVSNDDVAITQMYHYQSKNANESYCLQMQTTYKPSSKSLSPSTVTRTPSSPMHPHVNEPLLHDRNKYYGCPSHNSLLPSQSYHMNPNVSGIPPVMGMDHRIPRQYGGSAFTVPHYRHPQHMPFARNEYGYYQPAGPLIQPLHDQCTIHKPVPYHPQPHLHPSSQRPQPPASHLDAYPAIETHQSHRHNSPGITSHPAPAQQHQSKPAIPPCPSLIETVPQQCQTSLQYNRCQPVERVQSSNLSNVKSSYNQSSKPSPSPAVHPTYSLQRDFRDYHKQKQVPSSFGHFPKPYEQSSHVSKNCGSGPSSDTSHSKNKRCSQTSHFASHDFVPSHDSSVSTQQSLGIPHQSSMVQHEDMYKSSSDMMHLKESPWNIKTNHDEVTCLSDSFLPYETDTNKEIMPSVNMQETVRYPLRPPSVIEIVEDTSRDTKTYIQLEVPKNSHREKIVVVDVENDEVEEKCNQPFNSNKIEPNLGLSQEKPVHTQKEENSVKSEEKNISENSSIVKDIIPDDNKCESAGQETPDIMVIEVKKKKESAVVRRARLHGKQRTFRDCYNRPLAQLTKIKKSENLAVSEQHLTKDFQPLVSLPRLVLPKLSERRPAHGWSWEGPSFEKQVYLSNDDPPCIRRCYSSMRHVEGDVICVRDCVLLRSGPRKTDLPFVAKVSALWDNPVDGEMTMSLMWYYRPEHTETGKVLHYMEDEIFASKHRDVNSVACVEDKCYVLTYLEYCRYRRKCCLIGDNLVPPVSVVPEGPDHPRKNRLPPINVSPELVLFCRKVYDYRQKRLLKNPM